MSKKIDDERPHISQIQLVADIMESFERQGLKSISMRIMNKVAECATEIQKEVNRPDKIAKEGEGLAAWLASDDTGMSSKDLAYILSDNRYIPNPNVPYDSSDFGRCVRMLRVCPELRKNLPKMMNCGPIWKMLVEQWDWLESLYDEAVGYSKQSQINWQQVGILRQSEWSSSGALYDAIRAIHEKAK